MDAGVTYTFSIVAVNADGKKAAPTETMGATLAVLARPTTDNDTANGALSSAELRGQTDSTAAIKGQKNLSKNATVSSVSFEWNTTKMGATFAKVDKVEFFVIGPKPKGGTAPVVTSFVLNWAVVATAVTADGSWTGTAVGGYEVTVTANNGRYNITISGLAAGTKYSIQMRAVETGGLNAKGVTIKTSTVKYIAPKL